MGEQVGTNRSRPGAPGAFERVGPLTLQRGETREQEGEKGREEIRGRFGVFVLGKEACCKSSKGSSFSANVSFPCFSSPVLSGC